MPSENVVRIALVTLIIEKNRLEILQSVLCCLSKAKLPRKARQLNCLPIAKTAKLKIKDFQLN